MAACSPRQLNSKEKKLRYNENIEVGDFVRPENKTIVYILFRAHRPIVLPVCEYDGCIWRKIHHHDDDDNDRSKSMRTIIAMKRQTVGDT